MGTNPPGQGRSPMVIGSRYALYGPLGRGGMGEVHLAQDLRLNRSVAVKMLRPEFLADLTAQARFRHEAQSAASLNHPAVVAVYDTGEDRWGRSPLPYIVMEYVDGMTLGDRLRAGPPPTAAEAMAHVTGVLEALEYSHAVGIVHRDIKPANVMLTHSGAVKVMDFGIARAMDGETATMTAADFVMGTAAYLSPEQARGTQADARSDLYAAGCVLYELLTGAPPFTADAPLTLLYQHVEQPPVPPSALVPGLDPAVDTVVLKALAKDPADRFQSAAEMRAALGAAALGGSTAVFTVGGSFMPVAEDAADAGETADADDPEDAGYPAKPARTARWLVAAGAVVVATGLIVAGVAVLSGATSSGTAQASGTTASAAASGQDPASASAPATSDPSATDSQGAQIVIPDVEGESLAVARAELLALGLRESAPSDSPQAKVTGQSPAAGSRVSPGSVVSLTVSGSVGPAPDPSDLKGLAEAVDPGLGLPDSGATATSGSGSGDGGATATPSDSSSPSDSPSATAEPSDSQEPPATLPPGPIQSVGP